MPMSKVEHPIRVLIVDDSQFMRQTLRVWLNRDRHIKVVGTAGDAYEAHTMIRELNPDIITLDVQMPMMDGITFLAKLMKVRPMPVLMVSVLTEEGAKSSIRALELGAVDYIAKPTSANEGGWEVMLTEVARKIKLSAKANMAVSAAKSPTASRPLHFNGGKSRKPWVIAMGASTGGVEALKTILGQLPGNMPPILIVQHMPPVFTASLAERLDQSCLSKVQEARHGQALMPGHVYIATGYYHLKVIKHSQWQYYCQLEESEPINSQRPSIDVLFHSLAQQAEDSAVGVLLTGMGVDGAEGMLAIRNAGGVTVGQDEASSTIYGMVRQARTIGSVASQEPLDRIAETLVRICEEEYHVA